MSLVVKPFALGDWNTNCYIVHRRDDPRCWVIDAGFGPQRLIEYLDLHGLEPQRIILTHAHLDHIGGLEEVRACCPGAAVCLHSLEHEFLADPMQNLSAFLGAPFTTGPADEPLEHGQTLKLGDTNVEIRHTPGHSPGSVSLIFEEDEVAIVGDTLFSGSVGRTDFPHSDGPQLFESIRTQLLTLTGGTKVYPGHGVSTTIAQEKAANPFLRGELE